MAGVAHIASFVLVIGIVGALCSGSQAGSDVDTAVVDAIATHGAAITNLDGRSVQDCLELSTSRCRGNIMRRIASGDAVHAFAGRDLDGGEMLEVRITGGRVKITYCGRSSGSPKTCAISSCRSGQMRQVLREKRSFRALSDACRAVGSERVDRRPQMVYFTKITSGEPGDP